VTLSPSFDSNIWCESWRFLAVFMLVLAVSKWNTSTMELGELLMILNHKGDELSPIYNQWTVAGSVHRRHHEERKQTYHLLTSQTARWVVHPVPFPIFWI
jgi:hypothetical protein